MELRLKKLHTDVAVPPTPIRIPSQWPLDLSVTTGRLSANDTGDNEILSVMSFIPRGRTFTPETVAMR